MYRGMLPNFFWDDCRPIRNRGNEESTSAPSLKKEEMALSTDLPAEQLNVRIENSSRVCFYTYENDERKTYIKRHSFFDSKFFLGRPRGCFSTNQESRNRRVRHHRKKRKCPFVPRLVILANPLSCMQEHLGKGSER
jgi:hypothetical protein